MKKKHELLVPVGNYECLIAAINNGADAVYFAGKRFGARAFANNFTMEEIEKAIKLCHLYDVKVYITVNTLIYEDELDEVVDYIKSLHKLGVDALIMQDIGLINIVHNKFPNLEIHASTQMYTHYKGSIKLLEDLGIKRVVFAREMSIDEIESIDTSMEKEVFIHGSLCISYSGQCLFSSQILSRSGNRGECAGMCRLPYKLLENDNKLSLDGDYLLSPKDLCSVDNFKRLLDSNIYSFKIEGRMKSPEYVAIVTKIYRDLISKYENNEELTIDKNDFITLKSIFNREYTTGYLFNNDDILNIKAPNHQGIKVGNVVSITNKKIGIKLDKELKQFEGIRFKNTSKGLILNFIYDKNDNLINMGKPGDIIYIDNFINLNDKDEVMLTNPIINIDKDITKKIPISFHIIAKTDKPLLLEVSDNKYKISLESNKPDKSITSPITKERVTEILNKCGNTPFIVKKIDIEMDNNIFIPVGVLNKIRRDILDSLKEKREENKIEFIENSFNSNYLLDKQINGLSVYAKTKEQIEVLKKYKNIRIIVDNPKLYEDGFYFKTPRDGKKEIYDYKNILASDYSTFINNKNVIGDYHLNVTNHYTVNYLSKYSNHIVLSIENSIENIKNIMKYYNNSNIEVFIYGRVELMLMKTCLLKNLINKDNKCNVCFNKKEYKLLDRNNQKYPIITNPVNHSNIILNYKNLDLIEYLDDFKQMGIKNFRIDLYDETAADTVKIIEKIITNML